MNKLKILHLCPANFATGGAEGIHHLVSELNECGADAKILYIGAKSSNPQPDEYKKYNCPYITSVPTNMLTIKYVLIFPEIWGNWAVTQREYRDCIPVMNWQGIDVYDWCTPVRDRGIYLKRTDMLHITMSEYGMRTLRERGLNPMKISDCIADAYTKDFIDDGVRSDKVLYNPTKAKMTRFQETVMARATTELGVRFTPLEHYSQLELINLFRHSKLMIDFGAFSGRERMPREAVTQGCCIITSNQGTARDYADNSILDKYKIDATNMTNVDKALEQIKYVLHNYDACKPDFDDYRRLLKEDLVNYKYEVRAFYMQLERVVNG